MIIFRRSCLLAVRILSTQRFTLVFIGRIDFPFGRIDFEFGRTGIGRNDLRAKRPVTIRKCQCFETDVSHEQEIIVLGHEVNITVTEAQWYLPLQTLDIVVFYTARWTRCGTPRQRENEGHKCHVVRTLTHAFGDGASPELGKDWKLVRARLGTTQHQIWNWDDCLGFP